MALSRTQFQLVTASTLGAISAVVLLSTSAQAGVASELQNCKYNARQKTINCCEQVLRVNKKPLWLRSGNSSCTAMVKCASTSSRRVAIAYFEKPKCYVEIPHDENQGSTSGHTPTRERTRFTFN